MPRKLRGPNLTPGQAALLGTASDEEIGKVLGKTRHCVEQMRQYRGIKPHKRIMWPLPRYVKRALGTITDEALAKRLGVAEHTVLRWRKRLGIPPSRPELSKTLMAKKKT